MIVVVAAALAPVIVAMVLAFTFLDRSAQNGSADIDVSLIGCDFDGAVATVEYLASNNGSRDRTITLRWEYRDSGGARVDTDTTRVRVPAGDTVRGEESTFLNASTTSGRCILLG